MGTCIEIGVDGGDIKTREVAFGVAGSDSDTAHSITAGEPFYLNIRVENGLIHADVSASGFTTTTITPIPIPAGLAGFSAWGISSTVNGATVTELEIVERTPIITEANDRLVAVCNGDVWMSTSDTSFARYGVAMLASDKQPSMAEFDGLLYAVDGGRAIVIDTVTSTVFSWGRKIDPDAAVEASNMDDWDDDVSGYFPGSTVGSAGEHLKGTTDATVICTFNRRMYVASGRTMAVSAIDDPHDFLYGQNERTSVDGGAFFDAGWRDPIVGMWVTPQNALIVGCTRSIWVILGDPLDGTWTKQPLSLTVGASGLNAAHVGVGIPIVIHTPEGLQLVGIEGTPVPLSAPVIEEEIQFPYDERDSRFVTVVRDPQKYGLQVFTTPRDGTVERGFWYDERIGLYQSSNGGFFPDSLPSGMQPTCAAVWKGRVIFGCLDGYLRTFDTTKKTDDGVAIDDILTSGPIDFGVDSDSVVHAAEIELGNGTDFPAVRFYGGFTAEAAYDSTTRELLWQEYMQNGERKIVGRRSGVVVAQISTNLGNRRYALEGFAVDASAAGRLRRQNFDAVTAPALGCGVTQPVIPDDPGPDFPGGGGGGGGGGVDPECTGDGCEHADETLSWVSELAAAGGIPVPALECCCATDGSPIVEIQLSRVISRTDTDQYIVESATGTGTLGSLINCDATASVSGVTTSGYTIGLTVNCGMDVVWADEQDRLGFCAFVLGAGGTIDDAYEGVEILAFDSIAIQADCDRVLVQWIITYQFTDTLAMGKASGTVSINITGREGSCTA